MPNVVFDASSLVGALLKEGSAPERALLLARAKDTICLSDAVEKEIREVLARPKFARYLTPGRIERILDLLTAAAVIVEPNEAVTDCRDAKDNKYLELALSAQAEIIVASDSDLLALTPWRGISIITPAEYVDRQGPAASG
jgi:putative PIN family toxin of toxin-antitoxin system